MNEAEVIAKEINETPEVVTKVLRQVESHIANNRRQPRPPAPEGGISLSKASRKYHIPRTTISGWVSMGIIPIVANSTKEKYIKEENIVRIAKGYKRGQGRGNRQILQILSDMTSS